MKSIATFVDKKPLLNPFSSSVQIRYGFVYRLLLVILIILTFGMITLGGATRLTNSGLSIVSWDLIVGVIPPLTDVDWQNTFREYQKFPEYKIRNFTMTIDEFQRIFYFEYFHRLLGRIIGLISFLLFVVTVVTKQNIKIKVHTFFLFVLVTFQGLVGWYMVMSGLVDVPQVSHYRLFAHFFLALLYLSWLWYLLFQTFPEIKLEIPRFFSLIINMAMLAYIIQLAFGVFLAGLDAGLASYSYPLMFGHWIPENLMSFSGSLISKVLDNPIFINFFHRHWGILTAFLLGVVGITGRLFLPVNHIVTKCFSYALIILAVIQPMTGIITLVLRIPVGWGILHQFLAVLIWSTLLSFKLLTEVRT